MTIRLKTIPAVLVIGLAAAAPVRAEDVPTFKVEVGDNAITPQTLEVPANKPFRLEVRNTAKTPIEFESNDLRKEKVLAPGASSVLTFKKVSPGEYTFFDEFHPSTPKMKLIAK